MTIDCHVHIAACVPGHGLMSHKLLKSVPFRFMQWKFGLHGASPATELALEEELVARLDETPELDAVALLAFDAVHDHDGWPDWNNTHLYVTNDYAIELAARHPKLLFAASVHPYRKDAVAEIERCVAAGAVLMKWLPIVQNFNPADPKCIPFYEALAAYKLPLLCHTGSEHALPNLDKSTADPSLLRPALERGVTVIMAHCGTRVWPWETDFVPAFVRLAKDFEHCYGDTSALNVPARWYAYRTILNDPEVRRKLVHGSDWPILPMPPLRLGPRGMWRVMRDRNWIRRDIEIKRKLGLVEAEYWQRAGKVLRNVDAADRDPVSDPHAAAGRPAAV